MRIAIFSDTFFPDQINGAAHVAFQSAKILESRGHTVKVFTVSIKYGSKVPPMEKKFTIKRVPSLPFWGYARERITLPFGFAFRQVKKFNPDIIHAHMPFALGWEAVWAAKLLGKPLIGTHHTFFDHYLKHVKLDYLWFKKPSWKIVTAFYNRCDLVLTPSRAMAAGIRQHGLYRPVKVAANPVDTNLFHPATPADKQRLKEKFGLKGPVVLYQGRVSYEKSIDQILRAFARVSNQLPDAKLMIVGDGPERKKIEHLAHKLEIQDHVLFTGFLLGNDLVEAMQTADVFVTASKSENMPLSVLEAMGCGLPVIGVRALGIPEVVRDQISGFIVEPDQVAELAQKIVELLANPDLLRKFSIAAREFSMQHSYDTVGLELETIYEQLIKTV
jgi:glycosyltransferase involved in cell wall biosynthesis